MARYTECREDDGKPCVCARCRDNRKIENLRAAVECAKERESAKDAEIASLKAELDKERNLLGRVESFATAFLDHSMHMNLYGCVKECADGLRSVLKELADNRAARCAAEAKPHPFTGWPHSLSTPTEPPR